MNEIPRGDKDSEDVNEVHEGVGCYDQTTYSLLWCSEVWVITLTQSCYQVFANSKWDPAPKFIIGSHMFFKVPFFHATQPLKKLTETYLGPFEVITWAGSRSYTLWLPDSMHAVHLVFHILMLKPVTPNSMLNQVWSPLSPAKINGQPKYEMSKILDSKIDQHHRPCNLVCLVWWSGYESTDKETTWILVTELGHASKIVTEFHPAHPAKPET